MAADIALLVGYLGYILPETEKCVEKRKAMLEAKLDTKVDANLVGKSLGEVIVTSFGGYLYHVVETRQIEKWKGMFKQIKDYFIYSVFLALVAIILTILMPQFEMLQRLYIAEVFLVASAVYFISLAYYSLNHRADLHKWKLARARASA